MCHLPTVDVGLGQSPSSGSVAPGLPWLREGSSEERVQRTSRACLRLVLSEEGAGCLASSTKSQLACSGSRCGAELQQANIWPQPLAVLSVFSLPLRVRGLGPLPANAGMQRMLPGRIAWNGMLGISPS